MKKKESWSKEELYSVYKIYPLVQFSIHKHNKLIINLAAQLGKKVRGVENQLLMFRAVEKEILTNVVYGRKNYNKLVKEIFIENNKNMIPNIKFENKFSNPGDYPTKFKNFVKTNDGAVRKSHDASSGRPIGQMIQLPIHQFITKIIESQESNHKLLFLIGGPGNGKTDATDFALDRFISISNISNDIEIEIRRKYKENYSNNDNYYSQCKINNTDFYCIQDATSRMHQNPDNLSAFINVYNKFKESKKAILIVCINRGILNDFINQSKNNKEIFNLLKVVEASSNLESYLKEINNYNIIHSYEDFECSLSTYPLDKSSLFSDHCNIHSEVCEIINKSKWSEPSNHNFNQSYFQSITHEMSDLLNLYEVKNNKKITFRDYYHSLHVLFTPELLELKTIIDSPLLHLWKLASTKSINKILQLTKQLQDISLKKELREILEDLCHFNAIIEQNKTLNAIQEFHPNFLSSIWDTDKIYSLLTTIRDKMQNETEYQNSINFEDYNMQGITESEIHQIEEFIKLYSRIDNHILDTKTKEIEKIRKFVLIIIRNYLCAIDFRINGNYFLKNELFEFRKLDNTGSKNIQKTLRKLLRIKEDGSNYFKMKVALNNNIWEYSFNNNNIIEGEIENIEKAFDFKNISYNQKPPIEIKLFESKFSEGSEIITFIDFGTFLHIVEADSLFKKDFKRISSTISPNFKLWLNSEAEKFVAGRFNEIDIINIPKIARVNKRNNNRISIERLT